MNLSAYIESVLHSAGRFRSLGNVYAVMDDGEPRMTVGETWVDFEVVADGASCVLRCFLREAPDRLKDVARYSQLLDCKHIAPLFYFEAEMVVFDWAGRGRWVDVTLQRLPEGERLDRVAQPERVLQGLAELAAWLESGDFGHGNICARNVWITAAGVAVMTDYGRSSRQRDERDVLAVGLLSAAMRAAACHPDMAVQLRANMLTTKTLHQLEAMLKGVVDIPVDARGIARLAATPVCTETSAPYPAATTATPKYLFVGDMHDMVMRAFDGEHWVYLDKNGEQAFPGRFLSALDFAEGRAVIELKEGYGLIDLDGHHVIEPHCDDIDWDCANNVAIVTLDGLSGLFDRTGNPLTEVVYDQIMPGNEGLFPIRHDGRYGYIRRDGSVAVELQWDDAFAFREGLARVRDGSSTLLIDTEGLVIEKILS